MGKKKVIEPTVVSVADAIDAGKSEIESLKEEMETWRDNMEEKLSGTPKYEEVSEVCDTLDGVMEDLDSMDELNSDVALEELSIILQHKKRPSRNDRMSNAIGYLEAAKDAIDGRIETLEGYISDAEDAIDPDVCPECLTEVEANDMNTHLKDEHGITGPLVLFINGNGEHLMVSEDESARTPDEHKAISEEYKFSKDDLVEEKENLEAQVEYLGNAIDNAQGVSFPGMY